ncbi:very short patch repair endonuclease [Brucella intermedia]|uniref:very short patch repair endonuclease n=1 Tax=Brucella intermedia TaxID=94625 RepID=UPI00255552EC|nr:very short patch repair endonuclease [Brucella intermedia]MDL2201330.1 very short patch repair endonuclease [Brucella intermedia]
MSDHLTTSERSALMAKVRSKDTKPELIVRKTAHRLGYRFRLHLPDLPGTPDLVFPRHRLAVFVHGCFWHRHPNCRRATTPTTNIVKWAEKFERNRLRDARAKAELEKLGWSVLVIWECETRSEKALAEQLAQWLPKSISLGNHR